jgi:glycosyltransferase involved in cell wall biosynthesis
LAANARALPELVDHGLNGYLFNPYSSADLADTIRQFLARSDKWKVMGGISLQKARPHQIWNTVQRYVEWYESVLGRGRMLQLPAVTASTASRSSGD